MGLNIAMAMERTYITVHPAINVHRVALIFVNIIVDQIWLKSTIFRLLMKFSGKSALDEVNVLNGMSCLA